MTKFLIKTKNAFYISAILNVITLILFMINEITKGQANSLYLAINFSLLVYILCRIEPKENKKVQELSLKVDKHIFNFIHAIVIFMFNIVVTILKCILFYFICVIFPNINIWIFILFKLPLLVLMFGWICYTWDNEELKTYYIK